MRYFFENCHLVYPGHPSHGKKVSLKVENGKFVKDFAKTTKISTISDHIIAPTLIDTWAHISDPGYEYRETKKETAYQAAMSGVSRVYGLPSTRPVIDDKTKVMSVLRDNEGHTIHLLPLAAASQGLAGEDLTEMTDIKTTGIHHFTDGVRRCTDLDFVERSLAYLKGVGGVLHVHVNDDKELENGQIHQSKTSVSLGLKGIPRHHESSRIMDILSLVRYYDTPVHFANISTKESVQAIKSAKKEGLPITASTSLFLLRKKVDDLIDFDENLKVNPPLRSSSDQTELIKAIKKGDIDGIASNHQPKSIDEKRLEFSYAEPGVSTLQCFLGEMISTFGLEQTIQSAALGNRKIMNLPLPSFHPGEEADIMWMTQESWTLEKEDLLSKAANNPFVGQQYTHKVGGLIAHGKAMKL